MTETSRRILSGIGIGVVVGAIFSFLSWCGFLDTWEAKTYDWRLESSVQFDSAKSQVVMFYVDQASLDFMKQNSIGWPWPRALYGDVLRFCQAGGARAVVFDIIYSEDSVYGAADDLAFATGLQQAGNGFLAVFLSRKATSVAQDVAPILEKSAVTVTGRGVPIQDYPRFMALPIPPLMQAARGFGNVQLAPDGDGTYRRVPLLFGYQGKIIPSLYIGILHAEQPDMPIALAPQALEFGDHQVPLDAQGNMVLKYYGGVDTFPSMSLAHVMMAARDLKEGKTPEIDPATVKDKVVIIGVSAPGLYDLRPQPLASRYPGAEIHATAFQNILTNDYMRLVPQWVGLLGVLVLSIAMGIVLRLDVHTAVAVAAGMAALAIAIGVPFVLIRQSWWAPMVAPVAAVVGTFAVAMVVNYLAEGKKKRVIRDTFQKYLAPMVVKSLLKNPESIALGGVDTQVTVFFSDIANFTNMAEKMSAAELVAVLNDYLTRCSQIIMDDHGTIDKYIGDAVMAFWGAPLPMANHAEMACTAAIKVQEMLASWNAEREAKELPVLMTRIGIHTGTGIVGNMGSSQRMNYTVMGDAVNLASRLEGLNKFFGTQTIASGDCVKNLREQFLCRHLAAVRVKGREGVIEIYELRARNDAASNADRGFVTRFESALAAYRAGRLDDARATFEELARTENDVTSKRYVQWINAAARAPIGSDWDGVVTFDSK
jgi:adenylate cyclase